MNIVITGGTRGIGLNHAKYLAAQGHNLALIDISENACDVYGELSSVDKLLDQLSKNNTKNRFYKCDLTNYSDTIKIFNNIVSDYNKIDGCVFNVGGDVVGTDQNASGGKAKNNNYEIDIFDHDIIFNRNYRTTLNSFRAILPHFKEQESGKIVTTSSASANYGVTQETAYSISKSAVIQLTRSIAAEMRPYGINVNCIAPGGAFSGRFKATLEDRSKEDREKILSTHNSILLQPALPEHISSVVSFLLSNESQYISGQVIRIDGGQSTSPI